MLVVVVVGGGCMFTAVQLAFLGSEETPLFTLAYELMITSPLACGINLFLGGNFKCLIFRINVDDNSLDISYEEWRDYLLFHPSSDLASIINSWRHNTVSMDRYSKRD